jgi:hypothetical protein
MEQSANSIKKRDPKAARCSIPLHLTKEVKSEYDHFDAIPWWTASKCLNELNSSVTHQKNLPSTKVVKPKKIRNAIVERLQVLLDEAKSSSYFPSSSPEHQPAASIDALLEVIRQQALTIKQLSSNKNTHDSMTLSTQFSLSTDSIPVHQIAFEKPNHDGQEKEEEEEEEEERNELRRNRVLEVQDIKIKIPELILKSKKDRESKLEHLQHDKDAFAKTDI